MYETPVPIHGFSAALLPAMGQYEFIRKDANQFNGPIPIDRDYACLLWAHSRLSSGSSPAGYFVKNEELMNRHGYEES